MAIIDPNNPQLYTQDQSSNGITYEQLQNAKLSDLEANSQLATTFGNLYGYDGSKLLSYYKSGYRSFDADKAYTLSDRGGFNFKNLESHYNRYSNLNNPLVPQDYASALEARTAGLGELSTLENFYRSKGLDPSSIAQLQQYKTNFGSEPGGGTTSIQAAEAYRREGAPQAPQSETLQVKSAEQGPSSSPPGASLITSPAGLEGLTENQIWREPGTNRIFKLPEGMTKISGPSGLQGLSEDQIWRSANGDIYKKPSLDERLPGESVTDYTARVGSEVGTEDGTPAAGTSEAHREKLKQQIKDELLPDGGLPDAPNTAEERIRLRREQGVMNDEQDLNDLRNESRLAQEELRQFKATSGQGMSEYGRLGSVSEKERNLSFRLEGMALREQAVVERINSKNSYINQVMGDKQFDYQTAMQRWNMEFTTNAEVNKLVNAQLDQEQQDALSVVTTIGNLMKEAGVDYADWSPEMKIQTESAALKLGLPKDLFKTAFANMKPDEKILHTWLQPNPEGGMDAYSVVQGKDGPAIIKAKGGLPASAIAQEERSSGSLNTSTVDVGGRMLVIDEYGNTIKDLGPSKAGLEMESDQEKETAREISSENQASLVVSAVDEAIALIEPTSKLGPLGRVVASKVPGTKSFDLAKVIDTIKANLGFDALQKMRDQSPTGGALGAISDREIGLLQATVASLDIGQSTDQLEAKLNDIKTHYGNWQNTVTQAAAGKNGSAISEAMSFYGPEEVIKGLSSKPGATGTMIDVSRALGIPDQEYVKKANELGKDATKVWSWLKGKLPKSDDKSAAATETKRVANAIGQFESGGNYKALGPVLNSGSYKGDRAYGKYQIMGKNIPSWTKEALGRSMTSAQFLADKKAQDAVAEHRMGKLLAQGYGVEDIASIWFSGQPLSKSKGKKDQLGTSVPQYVKRVRSIYNQG